MALESFSPTVLVAVRFTLSGSILLIAARAMAAKMPSWRESKKTALYGLLTLGIGNGCLAFAEQWIPSGLAALFITTSPFWMVGMDALVPGGEKLHLPTIGGMAIGFAGAAMLVAPSGFSSISTPLLAGFLVLQFGSVGWSLGSILQRRQSTAAHPVVSGAIQQLAAGLAFVIPAAFSRGQTAEPSPRSIGAVLYLVVFGSIVGYSAYIYAMSKLPVSVVSLYGYVNPLVAVWLGWLFYREPFGPRELLGMAVIFLGVTIVKRTQPAPRKS